MHPYARAVHKVVSDIRKRCEELDLSFDGVFETIRYVFRNRNSNTLLGHSFQTMLDVAMWVRDELEEDRLFEGFEKS